jgi:hypothetical protein
MKRRGTDRTKCSRKPAREQKRVSFKTFFCDVNNPGACSPTKKAAGTARRVKARSLREAMLESYRRAQRSNRRQR